MSYMQPCYVEITHISADGHMTVIEQTQDFKNPSYAMRYLAAIYDDDSALGQGSIKHTAGFLNYRIRESKKRKPESCTIAADRSVTVINVL